MSLKTFTLFFLVAFLGVGTTLAKNPEKSVVEFTKDGKPGGLLKRRFFRSGYCSSVQSFAEGEVLSGSPEEGANYLTNIGKSRALQDNVKAINLYEKIALGSSAAFVTSAAICYATGAFYYSKYRQATSDEAIRKYKIGVRDNDIAVSCVTPLAAVSLGTWYYVHRRKGKYLRVGLVPGTRNTFGEKSDTRLGAQNPQQVNTAATGVNVFSSATLLLGGTAIAFYGAGRSNYFKYQTSTTVEKVRFYKHQTKKCDGFGLFFSGLTGITAVGWFYFDHQENSLLHLGLESDKQQLKPGSLQLGLIPEKGGSLGTRPGLVYTWRF